MARIKYLLMFIFFSSLHSFATQKKENIIHLESTNTGSVASAPEAPVPELFEKLLTLNKARIGNSEQIVLVTNENGKSIDVIIQLFEKINGQWVEKFTKTKGTIGRNGFARYKEKVEGDGKTPTGIFYLGPVFSYPGHKISTKMKYWEAGENDYWIDDKKSNQYNRWVTSDVNPAPNVSCEPMKRTDDKYKYGVAIQYNMDQIKGKGSVIVVHVLIKPGLETAGCIAIPEKELIQIIGWLDPAKKPTLIAGTVDELLTKPVSGPGLDNNDKYIWKKEEYAPPAK